MTENTTIDNTAENVVKNKKTRRAFVAFPLVKVFSLVLLVLLVEHLACRLRF